jgi:hypothetical protein
MVKAPLSATPEPLSSANTKVPRLKTNVKAKNNRKNFFILLPPLIFFTYAAKQDLYSLKSYPSPSLGGIKTIVFLLLITPFNINKIYYYQINVN